MGVNASIVDKQISALNRPFARQTVCNLLTRNQKVRPMRDRPNDHTHRRAVEHKLGRALLPNEIVHHENEDKADNSPINLAVKSRSVHSAGHNRTRGLSKLRASLRMMQEKKRLY